MLMYKSKWRPFAIISACIVLSIALFSVGVINYGNYQQAHRIKYIVPQPNKSE